MIGGNTFYFGSNPNSPTVGDTRVKFYVVETSEVSILAQQQNDRLIPFITSRGGEVLFIERGYVTAEEMIDQARESNTAMTWILRFVGFFACLIGFTMCFQPCVTFADVLPFVGDVLECGIWCLGAVVAGALSLSVIALAWLFYRPAVAIGILGGVALVCGGVWYIGAQRKQSKLDAQPSSYDAGNKKYEEEEIAVPASGSSNEAPFSQALG